MRNCYVLLTTGEASDAEDNIVCVYGYKPSAQEIFTDTEIDEKSAKELIEQGSVYVEVGDVNGYILKKSRLYE
jgi:hypothetical protein